MRQPYPNELYHYGVLGQKWGVRRYQNPDGTYTDAGKKRYNTGSLQQRRKAAYEDLNTANKMSRVDFHKVVINNPAIQDELRRQNYGMVSPRLRRLSEDILENRNVKENLEKQYLDDHEYIQKKVEAYGESRGHSGMEFLDDWLRDKQLDGQYYEAYLNLEMDEQTAYLIGLNVADNVLGRYSSRNVDRTATGQVSLGRSVARTIRANLLYPHDEFAEMIGVDEDRVNRKTSTRMDYINTGTYKSLPYSRYKSLADSLSDMGGKKYDNLPLTTRQKLIFDYNDRVPLDEGPGSKDASYEFRPNKEYTKTTAKDYYNNYMALHPNSELTFNEFKEWNIIN